MGRLKYPKKRINKLFLIGNGLDLALDLKTSYSDFILWLLKKFIVEAYNSNIKMASERYRGVYDDFYKEYLRRPVVGFSSNNLFDILINENYDEITLSNIELIDSFNKLIKFCDSNNIEIKSIITKGLFSHIKENCELGWVDIEGIYFSLIKFLLKNQKSEEEIDNLNEEMTHLKKFLFEYLSEIEIDISGEKVKEYQKQFNDDIDLSNYIHLNVQRKTDLKSTLDKPINYFLNFNYTNSLQFLLENFHPKNSTNHIHGDLKKDYESIIFGFGDEMDRVYKEIEELNDNRFFKHIKSFQYFKSKKYKELLSFLNSEEFQVCIYGHSCGLSDRIMLNEIFEHEKCKSIKIYFYDEKDYDTKTMEISRHFNNNQEMRKKILDFDPENRIPQVNE